MICLFQVVITFWKLLSINNCSSSLFSSVITKIFVPEANMLGNLEGNEPLEVFGNWGTI